MPFSLAASRSSWPLDSGNSSATYYGQLPSELSSGAAPVTVRLGVEKQVREGTSVLTDPHAPAPLTEHLL